MTIYTLDMQTATCSAFQDNDLTANGINSHGGGAMGDTSTYI